MAIDLGTANTLVFVGGRGIVLSEPSVVAVDTRSDEVRAVGADAKRLLALRSDAIVAVRPVQDGVITDFERAEEMLKRLDGPTAATGAGQPSSGEFEAFLRTTGSSITSEHWLLSSVSEAATSAAM